MSDPAHPNPDPLAFVRTTAPGGAQVDQTVFLARDLPVPALYAAVEDAFGSDDEVQVAALADHRGVYGFVVREELLASLAPLPKAADWGDSDGLTQPGEAHLEQLTLRCPVDGETFLAYFIEPGGPPTCPHHPTARLTIQSA